MNSKNTWIISNLSLEKIDTLSTFIGTYYQGYSFYSLNNQPDDALWYSDGMAFIQNNALSTSKAVEQHKQNSGEGWERGLSGNFTLINLQPQGFTVYSDPFAVKKFFYWREGRSFIISNDLGVISKIVKLRPSVSSMARYAIHYHFTAGTTAFAGVYHNTPAQRISYTKGNLEFDTYWEPQELLQKEKGDVDIKQISHALSQAVDNGLDLIGQQRISLSLTGGADTRNLLSIFLSKGIKPHLYTYGNPHSADCVKATAIARGLGLEHTIHDIQMTSDLFEQYARTIIRSGGGLASIHRVHRVIAVEREQEYADYMFLGTLGGEFVKGVSEDDYIVSASVYENWAKPEMTKEVLLSYLQNKFIRAENIEVAQMLKGINVEPYMQGNVNMRKHNALSFITAHLHDAQDVNLYGETMEQVFTPFLDIPYLELLFSSPFTFNHKEVINNKYLRRMENPVYGSNFLKVTYPPLLRFLYSGDHKPSEVLFNKYYAAFTKAIRQKTGKGYAPNFPLGTWMVEFVEKHLPQCQEHEALNQAFNLPAMLKEFSKGGHRANEAYWLQFTNPIMMKFLIEEFC